MRFFKLVEIEEQEYIEQTRDLNYCRFCNTVSTASDIHPEDKNIYVAVDDIENTIVIDLADIENEEEDDEYEDEDEVDEDEG